MDKQELFSAIGYLKAETYKPALRPYVTALMRVLDYAEEQLQRPAPALAPLPEGWKDLSVDAGAVDVDRPRRREPTRVDAEVEARRLRAERQARWRAKQKQGVPHRGEGPKTA
jgi:hypothetical protein